MTPEPELDLSALLQLHEELTLKIASMRAEIEKLANTSFTDLPTDFSSPRLGFEEFCGFLQTAQRQVERAGSSARYVIPARSVAKHRKEIDSIDDQLTVLLQRKDTVLRSILDVHPLDELEIATKMDFIVSYIVSFPEVEFEYLLYYISVCADDLRQMANRFGTNQKERKPLLTTTGPLDQEILSLSPPAAIR